MQQGGKRTPDVHCESGPLATPIGPASPRLCVDTVVESGAFFIPEVRRASAAPRCQRGDDHCEWRPVHAELSRGHAAGADKPAEIKPFFLKYPKNDFDGLG